MIIVFLVTSASLMRAAEQSKNQDDTMDLDGEAVPDWMCHYPASLSLLADGYLGIETRLLVAAEVSIFLSL